MTVLPILALSFIKNVVAVLFVISCVSLVLIILIQKGRGGGLSGAFGGAMASGILGSKTGDFLTWVTISLVGVFLLLAVVMAKIYKPDEATDYDINPQTQQQPLESTEKPVPSDAAEETTGQGGTGTDINSPDS